MCQKSLLCSACAIHSYCCKWCPRHYSHPPLACAICLGTLMVYTNLNLLFRDVTIMILPEVSDTNATNKHCQALSHTFPGATCRQLCKCVMCYSYFADEKTEACKFPKVTQLTSGRAGTLTQVYHSLSATQFAHPCPEMKNLLGFSGDLCALIQRWTS